MDFDAFFRRRKVEPAEDCEILAVIVSDKAPESVIEVLKAEGFDLDADGATKGRASTVFPQVEFDIDDEDEHRIAKQVNDHVVVLSRVEKAFQPFQGSTSFKENLASEGFFPKAGLATGIFGDTVAEIMFQSESKGDAATRLKEEGTSFVSTLVDLVNALPTKVFKLEAALDAIKVEKTEEKIEVEVKVEKTETEVETETETEVEKVTVRLADGSEVEAELVTKDEKVEDEPEATDIEEKAGFTDPIEEETEKISVTKIDEKPEAIDVKSIADAVLAAIAPRLDALNERIDGTVRRQKEVDSALLGHTNVGDLGDLEDDESAGAEPAAPAFIDTGMRRYQENGQRILNS